MKMLKNCFEYYFSNQSKETLIDVINTQNDLQSEVKQDLIASVILNQPDQLMEKVNNLPEHHMTDLMASIIQAREVCINQKEIQTEKPTAVSKSQCKRNKRNNRRRKH
jgi:hypothetical protein